MHSFLRNILARKENEVAILKATELAIPVAREAGRLLAALQRPGLSVIAEVKRASPSKGHLADIVDPAAQALCYQQAAAISVLTDAAFKGELADLYAVVQAVPQPVLRKDFIIDEVQLVEAALAGASAVLLIVAVLGEKTAHFIQLAKQYGLDALVEVHSDAELQCALAAQAEIIGVNNRDLTTFAVNPEQALELLPQIPAEVVTVAESGMISPAAAHRYQDFNAVLIGEALVKSAEPNVFIQKVSHGQR